MEPVYKWEPITDEYKTQAAEPVALETIEAESQQKLHEIHEAVKKENVWVEKKAPIGIRVFTWYLFCRAGFYVLLLTVLATFPQSGTSTWLTGNLGHFLPGASAREEAAKQRVEMQKEAEAQGYTLPDDDAADQQSPEQAAQQLRQEVMVYLLILNGGDGSRRIHVVEPFLEGPVDHHVLRRRVCGQGRNRLLCDRSLGDRRSA